MTALYRIYFCVQRALSWCPSHLCFLFKDPAHRFLAPHASLLPLNVLHLQTYFKCLFQRFPTDMGLGWFYPIQCSVFTEKVK